jgi:hypothetical protein
MPYMPDPDTLLDVTPIMFINNDGKIDATEIGMITAYIYNPSHLNLEEAARMAAALDVDAANELLTSCWESTPPVIEGAVLSILW